MKKNGTGNPKDPAEATRDDRLKAALRANLARRKAQSRARASTRSGGTDTRDKNEG